MHQVFVKMPTEHSLHCKQEKKTNSQVSLICEEAASPEQRSPHVTYIEVLHAFPQICPFPWRGYLDPV